MLNVLHVPRKWLFLLAGITWTFVGIMLCSRAILWAEQMTVTYVIVLEMIGITLASLGYFFGFARIVKRNITRIHSLPTKANVFAFTPLRGYIMIGIMISMGILLRSLPFPKYYLSIPYTAMGGALLMGSVQFYWQYSLALSTSQRNQ